MPPRHLRSLPAVLESLANGPGAKRLPAAIEALELRVHAQFNNKRDWYVRTHARMPHSHQGVPPARSAADCVRKSAAAHRRAIPGRGAVDARPLPYVVSLRCDFAYAGNMPSRTIVFGDKSTNDITRELMTMAQFTE